MHIGCARNALQQIVQANVCLYRIRRAGYPIRHTFAEFVDRYRILVAGVGSSMNEDCRAASNKIGKAVLGDADFQLGKTKVFLKVCMCVCTTSNSPLHCLASIVTSMHAILRCGYCQFAWKDREILQSDAINVFLFLL